MPNGQYKIDEGTFKKLPVEDQNWITLTTFNEYREEMKERVKKLENKKKTDTGISAISGFLGGFVAFFSSKLFSGK